MIVLGIDPGTAATGYGVVQSAGSRLRALDGGVIRTRAGVALELRLAEIHARVAELLDRHQPGVRGRRGALLRGQRADGVRRRPGAGRGPARRRAARPARPLVHAAAGQGRRLRPRARRQGAGLADGHAAARALPSPPRPIMPPTRSRWRSATSTARRWRRRYGFVIALISGEVALRRASYVVVSCGGRRLPADRLGRDAQPRPGRRRARDPPHPARRPRRRAAAVRVRHRGGARAVPDAALGPVGRARRSRSRSSPAGPRASSCQRSRRATRRASRPSRGSASAPPSGSSSSSATRSPRRSPSSRSGSRGAMTRARSPARAWSSSATARRRPTRCSTASPASASRT